MPPKRRGTTTTLTGAAPPPLKTRTPRAVAPPPTPKPRTSSTRSSVTKPAAAVSSKKTEAKPAYASTTTTTKPTPKPRTSSVAGSRTKPPAATTSKKIERGLAPIVSVYTGRNREYVLVPGVVGQDVQGRSTSGVRKGKGQGKSGLSATLPPRKFGSSATTSGESKARGVDVGQQRGGAGRSATFPPQKSGSSAAHKPSKPMAPKANTATMRSGKPNPRSSTQKQPNPSPPAIHDDTDPKYESAMADFKRRGIESTWLPVLRDFWATRNWTAEKACSDLMLNTRNNPEEVFKIEDLMMQAGLVDISKSGPLNRHAKIPATPFHTPSAKVSEKVRCLSIKDGKIDFMRVKRGSPLVKRMRTPEIYFDPNMFHYPKTIE